MPRGGITTLYIDRRRAPALSPEMPRNIDSFWIEPDVVSGRTVTIVLSMTNLLAPPRTRLHLSIAPAPPDLNKPLAICHGFATPRQPDSGSCRPHILSN